MAWAAKVNVDNDDDNETLLSKLQSGVVSYDICVPSDYMIKILIEEKLIRPLDLTRLKNIKNIDSKFRNLYFDKGNQYTVPYLWGTTAAGRSALDRDQGAVMMVLQESSSNSRSREQ